jgi:polysaccharide chain length determinant protein (PEP-CTERM system associated)
MSPRIVTPDVVVRAIARWRWVILIPFAIGVAIAPLLAGFAPERYRSETLIMVVPQRVPDIYVKPTITESVEKRLPAITDQILSRSRLEQIINEMDLYREERARQVMEDVVAQMRLDVNVRVDGRDADSFRVSYVSDNPETAQRVAERLASLYIEQNLTDRNNQAESTSQFLESQLEQARQRLIAQEKKLEEYRRQYSGQLPSQIEANVQAIQNARVQLSSVNDAINRAQERRLLIERQIADTQAIPLPETSFSADNPAGLTTAQQLELARARLAAYLQRYTPNHPEVVSLQRTISELVAKVGEEAPLSGSGGANEIPLSPAEAARKKKILDLEAQLAVLDRQMSTHTAEEKRLQEAIASYQARLAAAPSRESELVELTRDYQTLQTAYSNLLMKREQSVIAANLERRQIGEQFRILDPASRPERPFNQLQRLAVMASGAIAGLVLGLLLVALQEFRDSSFRRQEEVQLALNLPVLALIPVIVSEREEREAGRRTRRQDLAGAALLLTAVIIVVFWQLQP